MGEVWKAWDTQLLRRVALKRLPPGGAFSSQHLQRFLREARALASLASPSIVALYAAENLDRRDPAIPMYLVMEYVEGETLEARLARGPLTVGAALDLLRPLASALASAHDAGVTHRDLKPANIIIRLDGSPVIVDFGLALLQEHLPDSYKLTETGMVAGTAAYMAPEQARGLGSTPAADVWACGILLFEMLSGKHPFPASTPMEQLVAVIRDEPLSIEKFVPDLPESIRRLLARCLTKDLAGRPRSGRDLLGLIPPREIPAAAESPLLFSPHVIAEAIVHPVLGTRLAGLSCLLGVLGIAVLCWGSWKGSTLPRDGRMPPLEALREKTEKLSFGLGIGRGSAVFTNSGMTWLGDFGAAAWVRRSAYSLIRFERPPTATFPDTGMEGEVRVFYDLRGRMLFWQWWPSQLWAPSDLLQRLAAASGAELPLRHEGPGEGSDRGIPVELWQDSTGETYQICRNGSQILRFGLAGFPEPPGRSQSSFDIATFVLLCFVSVSAIQAWRNVKMGLADLNGALALGTVASGIQILKLVFNPGTITSGIWPVVIIESLGIGVCVLAGYLAFEPRIRRTWPGTLAAWARLSTLRRTDAQVGQELLVGAAAVFPLALWVFIRSLFSEPYLLEWNPARISYLGDFGAALYIQLDLLQSSIVLSTLGLLLASLVVSALKTPRGALFLGFLVPVLILGGDPRHDVWALATVLFLAAICAVLVLKSGLVAVTVFFAVSSLCLASPPAGMGTWVLPFGLVGPVIGVSLAVLGWFLAFEKAKRCPSGMDDGATKLLPANGSPN